MSYVNHFLVITIVSKRLGYAFVPGGLVQLLYQMLHFSLINNFYFASDHNTFENKEALRHAVQTNSVDEVKRLLDLGVTPNCNNSSFNRTPLHYAAEHEDEEVGELLLMYGADVDAPDSNEWTPLHRAAKEGHDRVCEVLLRYGANVEAVDVYDRTPIRLANAKGHHKASNLLLQHYRSLKSREN